MAAAAVYPNVGAVGSDSYDAFFAPDFPYKAITKKNERSRYECREDNDDTYLRPERHCYLYYGRR